MNTRATISTRLCAIPSKSFSISHVPRRVIPHRRVVTSAFLSDVSKYLSEAAASIFHPMKDDVPWERGSEPFTGRIVHHEEVSKLRQLAEEVRSVRKQLETTAVQGEEEGEGDTFTFDNEGELVTTTATSADYISGAINRLFGHNFKGDVTEPKSYYGSSGYRARGRTQRELRREVERLRRFETVVKQALEKAEVTSE
jgi:hypothetical protein